MRENNFLRGNENYGSGHFRHFVNAISRSFMKSSGRSTVLLVFSVILIVGALVFTRPLYAPIISGSSSSKPIITTATYETRPYRASKIPNKPRKQLEIPLDCAAYNATGKCPSNYPTTWDNGERSSSGSTCPEYFRWIHEDLKPWARTGITKDMVQRANATANFKLVIFNGKAYLETYQKAFQTRDVFTLWGILQLLRRYPGMVPDLELMFDCVDWPVVQVGDYSGPNARRAPPLFRYCGNDATLDIVFPDWSFWGWPEVNIKPWEKLLGELKEGNKRTTWMDREPYAYWKGNPFVAETRQDLMKCNVSDKQDWNARLYAQMHTHVLAQRQG